MSKVENELLANIQYCISDVSVTGANTKNYGAESDLDIKEIIYDPTGRPNSQRAINEAAEKNLNVVFPKANELFIDIDNEHSFQMYIKQSMIARRHIGMVDEDITPSKSGLPKRHIIVTLDHDVTEVERAGLQAMLGSDRVRELLAYVQAKNNDPHPTLFLEKKVLCLKA